LKELGLEIANEKTKFVDFRDDDFDFLGFTFQHWRKRKKDGEPYFIVKPKETTWKDFRHKIKFKTRKTLTLNPKAWLEQVNPIIRGKVNYFLTIYKAIETNRGYGQGSRCFVNSFGNELKAIDAYIRKRLRVAMIHRHPSQRKGWAMTTKWNNEFFARIGLVPSYWLYYSKQFVYTIENYIEYMKNKQKKHTDRKVQRAKEKGQEHYTPDLVRKMQYAQRLASY
jgi:RNA-directed DNA polymerase